MEHSSFALHLGPSWCGVGKPVGKSADCGVCHCFAVRACVRACASPASRDDWCRLGSSAADSEENLVSP